MFGSEPHDAFGEGAAGTGVQIDDRTELLAHHVDKRPCPDSVLGSAVLGK
ncbi:hypothetical protein ACPEIC_28860 [Stenotrophomonas sp. NPDC087984]